MKKILPTKGNTKVVMPTKNYQKKIDEILQDENNKAFTKYLSNMNESQQKHNLRLEEIKTTS